jgi:hypothetical protein
MDDELFDLLFSSDSSSSGSTDLDEAIDSAVALTIGTMMDAAKEDEEEEGGARDYVFRRRAVVQRRREEANERLNRFYFDAEPVYGPRDFRRRYRMSKRLFLMITNDLEEAYRYFQQKVDCRGRLGFTAIQKCTSALRQLAYGSSVDSFDENLEMSARVSRESLTHFCRGTILYLLFLVIVSVIFIFLVFIFSKC